MSSYTSTVDPLLVDDPTESTDPFSMLAVIQSTTPGVQQMDHGSLPPLPSTETELRNIRKHVPPDYLVALGVTGAAASVEIIESHMPKSSIVYFACYGSAAKFSIEPGHLAKLTGMNTPRNICGIVVRKGDV